MFARSVSVPLKPNTLPEFNRTFEKEILPLMQKQTGFRDELILANENANHITAISLWDSKTQADDYGKTAYAQVLRSLEKVLEGAPTVNTENVILSTPHKVSTVVAA
jgi:hypothetical protein